jgi:hypothetical protein
MRAALLIPLLLGLAAPLAAQQSVPWDELDLLGGRIAPGSRARLELETSESFAGSTVVTPVHVVRGQTPGPTVCLFAGIHGDELNGIEIVRQVFETLDPGQVSGSLVGMPVANLHGFRRSSRYLPDRRDLNRYFPGHPGGSSASRIAHKLFQGVVTHCDALVDFHTGSFHRTNLPQIRADLARPEVEKLALGFGVRWIIHSPGQLGTLRRAAMDHGIPAITYEAGEPLRFHGGEITRGLVGVRQLLRALGMIDGDTNAEEPTLIRHASWVRVADGGIFIPARALADKVEPGDILGTVTDPITNERSEIRSPAAGRIIGMALSQVVIPGFAAFHLGDENATLPESGPLPSTPMTPEELDPEERPE